LPLAEYFCPPLIKSQVDPVVWMDGYSVWRAKTIMLSLIHLKDPSVSSPKPITTETQD
jgi:hypothetical protein